MKRTLKPAVRVLLTTLSLASLLLLHTPAATATPVISGSNCESGASQLLCYVWYSNTVNPVYVTWYFYQGSNYQFSADGDIVQVSCQRNRMYTYYANVSDPTGTAQASGNIYCNPGPWP